MAEISVVLAIAAPLLRARLRSVLMQDPGISVVHDAVAGADAAQQVLERKPQIMLCDRLMLTDSGLAALARQKKQETLAVLVTVNIEAMPAQALIPIAGTLPFTIGPGDMTSRLRAMLHIAAAPPPPMPIMPPPTVEGLRSRFTVSPTREAPVGVAAMSRSIEPATSPRPSRQPVPTKTAQLKMTSFLKSILDDVEPATGQSQSSFRP